MFHISFNHYAQSQAGALGHVLPTIQTGVWFHIIRRKSSETRNHRQNFNTVTTLQTHEWPLTQISTPLECNQPLPASLTRPAENPALTPALSVADLSRLVARCTVHICVTHHPTHLLLTAFSHTFSILTTFNLAANLGPLEGLSLNSIRPQPLLASALYLNDQLQQRCACSTVCSV